MRFANPQLLWLLLLVPALIVGIALRYGWRRRTLARLGDPKQVQHLTASVSHGRRLLKNLSLIAGVTLLILTLARLVERKGQDKVISALPEVLSSVPEAIYLIAGDGHYRRRRAHHRESTERSQIHCGRASGHACRYGFGMAP